MPLNPFQPLPPEPPAPLLLEPPIELRGTHDLEDLTAVMRLIPGNRASDRLVYLLYTLFVWGSLGLLAIRIARELGRAVSDWCRRLPDLVAVCCPIARFGTPGASCSTRQASERCKVW